MYQKFFQNKKVLITGHTGFKGAWLTQIMLNFGAKVSGVSLEPNTNPNLFTLLNFKKTVKNYMCDLRDAQELKKIIAKEKPDIVFHLAAQAIVRESYDDPVNTFSTNVMGTVNLFEAIRKVPSVKAVVVITSDKVYKNVESYYPYREDEALDGQDPYSASKSCEDIVSNSYIKSFFNPEKYGNEHNTLIAIARAGNVVGGGDWAKYRLVSDIARQLIETKEELVIRFPEAVRPWQHVLDPLSGYIALSKGLYEGNKICAQRWNFGPEFENTITVEDLVKKAIKLLGYGTYRVERDASKHEAILLRVDVTKAKLLLDWSPKIQIEECLNLTFELYEACYKGKPISVVDNQIRDYFKL